MFNFFRNNKDKIAAELWPVKFLVMAITEDQQDVPSTNELDRILTSVKIEVGEKDKLELLQEVSKWGNMSEKEWNSKWDKLCSLLPNYLNTESYSIAQQVARIAIVLKTDENYTSVSQNFAYRVGHNFETHSKVCKSDFIMILKEEKDKFEKKHN